MKWAKRERQNEYPVDGAGTVADGMLNDDKQNFDGNDWLRKQ
jgi:hypothetical protein